MEEQLVALKQIAFDRRMINLDATGKLVKITKQMHTYKQILTYGFVAQDLDMLSEGKYLVVSKTSTSSHDTHSISKMFLRLKVDYNMLFKNEKNLCK